MKEVRGVQALQANLGLPPQTEILPIPYKVFSGMCMKQGTLAKSG